MCVLWVGRLVIFLLLFLLRFLLSHLLPFLLFILHSLLYLLRIFPLILFLILLFIISLVNGYMLSYLNLGFLVLNEATESLKDWIVKIVESRAQLISKNVRVNGGNEV